MDVDCEKHSCCTQIPREVHVNELVSRRDALQIVEMGGGVAMQVGVLRASRQSSLRTHGEYFPNSVGVTW